MCVKSNETRNSFKHFDFHMLFHWFISKIICYFVSCLASVCLWRQSRCLMYQPEKKCLVFVSMLCEYVM